MAKKTAKAEGLRSDRLATALKAQDVAAVAFAIRNATVIVPLVAAAGPPQVRVFRRDDADRYMLLLFSSAANYERMLPGESDLRSVAYDAVALREFLETNTGVLESVWFDVAGPHPMQAEPAEVLKALNSPRPIPAEPADTESAVD